MSGIAREYAKQPVMGHHLAVRVDQDGLVLGSHLSHRRKIHDL